jgi:glycosyltransferase involved in cell wall biosynthesis
MPHLRQRGIKIMLDAKAVFFLSEPYRKQVFEKYVPKKYHATLMAKSHIIPNGIDEFWFENEPKQENRIGDPIKLIYAGRIDRNKNIPTTQKAMELLRERGYRLSLTVVGRVNDKKIYEKIKQDPYTECLAPHPKETLLELYRGHDLFVMPSFTESFGLVYAEAMSQGLPVIYSQGQGFDNQFPEGTVGYHVDAHDARSVADAIERVVQGFMEIAPNTVAAAKKFNWKEISARYDRIYRTILGEDGE